MSDTQNEIPLLRLLADIRAAVGDPKGRLMQDELVEHCRKLKAERDQWKQKAERQAKRLRMLEGATNHAGGLRK